VIERKKLIQVRKALLEDVNDICRICSEGWRDTYQDIYSLEYIERTIAEFYNPQRVEREILHPVGWDGWLVAEQDGVVVGAGGGGLTSSGVGEVFVLYVYPGQRGQGIGTALLKAITDQQRQQGVREQWVSVEAKNEKGLPFYEAGGFIHREERPAYGSKPEEGIFSLRLSRTI
jgi:GNAT superfamily N-acetyltransferase